MKTPDRFRLAGATLLVLALVAVGLAGLLSALRRPRRRRWIPATAALLLVTLPLASCQLFGLNQEQTSALWKVAPDATLYFHQGGTAGPSIVTKSDTTIFEERRYEPFGHPIDAYRDGVGVTNVDFLRDPQNSLGKMTDPTTGWSYHGARWLMPQTGRWTSPDPGMKGPDPKALDAPWNLNPYSFVSGNPSLYWDPDGRCQVLISGAMDCLSDSMETFVRYSEEIDRTFTEGRYGGTAIAIVKKTLWAPVLGANFLVQGALDRVNSVIEAQWEYHLTGDPRAHGRGFLRFAVASMPLRVGSGALGEGIGSSLSGEPASGGAILGLGLKAAAGREGFRAWARRMGFKTFDEISPNMPNDILRIDYAIKNADKINFNMEGFRPPSRPRVKIEFGEPAKGSSYSEYEYSRLRLLENKEIEYWLGDSPWQGPHKF